MPGDHDAQPPAFEVELGGVAAPGERVPGEHDVVFPALEAVGRVDGDPVQLG